MLCGRTVIDRACPVCGGMYLAGEPLVVSGETIGMTIRCSMPGCRAVVSTEYSDAYRREIAEEDARAEAEGRAWAKESYEQWMRDRSRRRVA